MLIEVSRCTGCGRCVSACPLGLFTLEVAGYRKHALMRDPGLCNGCLKCLDGCPVGALGADCPGGGGSFSKDGAREIG
jgi:ferredoxin